jgi:hypothetical protein
MASANRPRVVLEQLAGGLPTDIMLSEALSSPPSIVAPTNRNLLSEYNLDHLGRSLLSSRFPVLCEHLVN